MVIALHVSSCFVFYLTQVLWFAVRLTSPMFPIFCALWLIWKSAVPIGYVLYVLRCMVCLMYINCFIIALTMWNWLIVQIFLNLCAEKLHPVLYIKLFCHRFCSLQITLPAATYGLRDESSQTSRCTLEVDISFNNVVSHLSTGIYSTIAPGKSGVCFDILFNFNYFYFIFVLI